MDRRRSTRYPLRLPAEIVAVGGNPVNLKAQTSNISSTGVLLHCSEELSVAQAVEYVITLYPEFRLRLRCKGRVGRSQWVSAPAAGTPGKYAAVLTVESFTFVRSQEA